MTFASASGLRVACVAEDKFGVTPAKPKFQTLRVTSGGLRSNKTTETSKELQPDRNIRDLVLTGTDITGSYPFELSDKTFDDLFAAALFGAWDNNVLKNGVKRQSFTFEETLDLGSGKKSFSRFTGCMINSLSLDIQSRQMVTGSFDIMGMSETLGDKIIADATYIAARTGPVMNSVVNVADLTVSGIAPAPKIRSVQLQIANNLQTRPVVASAFSDEFGEGMCEVTGSLEAYFTSNALYRKILDHGSGGIDFTVGSYKFSLPKAIFNDGQVNKGGQSDDVIVEVPFQAVYDPTKKASIVITRS